MNNKIIPVGFCMLVLAALAIFPGGRMVLGFLVVIGLLVILAWLIERYVWVRVPALKTAVTYDRETRGFMRLLPSGRHWITFPLEHIVGFITTAPGMIKGSCPKAETNGGLTVQVEWSLAYVLNPTHMEASLRPSLAKAFADGPENLLRTHVNNCLQQYISQQTVARLHNEGARGRIEREVRELIAERLHPFGVQVFRIILHSLELPYQIRAGLEEAHKQELLANGEAHAMERLQQALNKFSDADMARLLQLKQLDVLGQNGVAVQIPVLSMNGEMVIRKPEKSENGNGRSAAFTPSSLPSERPYAH